MVLVCDIRWGEQIFYLLSLYDRKLHSFNVINKKHMFYQDYFDRTEIFEKYYRPVNDFLSVMDTYYDPTTDHFLEST